MSSVSPLLPRADSPAPAVRLPLHTLIVSALLLGATACFSPTSVTLEMTRPMDLNPRIRLDRKPLDYDQANVPEYAGPYRDGYNDSSDQCKPSMNSDAGGCEVVSPITPDVIRAPQLEKLLQSNCLWIGDPAPTTNPSNVDPVSVAWEFVAHVRREPMHLACGSPVHFGLCRLQEPGTARALEFQDFNKDFAACSEAEDPVSETMDVAFGTFNSLPLSDKGGPLILDTDMHIASTPLVAEYVSAGTSDPYRSCPGTVDVPQAIAGGTTQAAPLSGGEGCGAGGTGPSAAVDACARNCTAFAPSADVALRLRDTSTNATRWLRPNLMTIRDRQSIARRMSTISGNPNLRRWNVEASTTAQRWHENFSSTLKIERVRVFVPGPNPAIITDDTAPALDPAMQSLVVSGTYMRDATNADPFTISCTGVSNATTNGWVYDFTSSNCSGNQLANFLLGATPAYTHQMLNLAALPLTEPLHWDVRLAGGASTPVMIEFQLRALARGSFLLASQPAVNFGDLVIGEKGNRFITFENIGDAPLNVTSATLGGTDPGDFGFRLLSARVPIPLPLSIAMTPHKRVLKQLEGYPSIPLDVAATATVGPTHTHLVRTDRDGQTLNLFNNQLSYDGTVGIYRDAPRPVPYVFPAGTVPLATLDAYTEAHLPLILGPGKSLRVMVKAQPSSYGVRRAQIKVEAFAAAGGQTVSAAVVLLADGKTGGDPRLHPSYAPLSDVGRAGGDRLLLLENAGDRDVLRKRISFTGAGNFSLAAGTAIQQVLAPGTSEVIRVRFVPTCPSNGAPYPARGRVLIETDWGTVQADLAGYADCLR